jgi:hypothetical protein
VRHLYTKNINSIFSRVIHGTTSAVPTLYENEFQNPQIFQQTISLFPEQSTLHREGRRLALAFQYSAVAWARRGGKSGRALMVWPHSKARCRDITNKLEDRGRCPLTPFM